TGRACGSRCSRWRPLAEEGGYALAQTLGLCAGVANLAGRRGLVEIGFCGLCGGSFERDAFGYGKRKARARGGLDQGRDRAAAGKLRANGEAAGREAPAVLVD